MSLYLYLNGVTRGPFGAEKIDAFLREGLLQDSDLVSVTGTGDWRTLSSYRATTPESPSPPLPVHQAVPGKADVQAAKPAVPLRAVDRDQLGPYVRSTLAEGETPLYIARVHWIIFVRYAALALVMFIFAAVPFAIALQVLASSELGWWVLPFPVLLLIPPALAFAGSEIVVTDQRLLVKSGFVSRQTFELLLVRVESVSVDQGFFGRTFDYGSVTLRGTGGFEETFPAIARPAEFQRQLRQLQHRAP